MYFTQIAKDNRIFQKAYRNGIFINTSLFTAYYIANGLSFNRLGITTSKKLGNAVERKRAARIIRAAVRLSEVKFPIGYDIIFVARTDIINAKSCDVQHYIENKLIPNINYNGEKGKYCRNKSLKR